MKIIALAASLVLVVSGCVSNGRSTAFPAAGGSQEVAPTAWMSSDDYIKAFEANSKKGLFAAEVEGRVGPTRVEFRAVFAPLPTNVRRWGKLSRPDREEV